MDWKAVDEGLIRLRGLILFMDSLGNHEKELVKMNKGRPDQWFNYMIAG